MWWPAVEDQFTVDLELPGVEAAPHGDFMIGQVSGYQLPQAVALPGERAELGRLLGEQQQQLLFPRVDCAQFAGRASGGGVAVAAPVTGAAVSPVRLEAPAAVLAEDQPGQQIHPLKIALTPNGLQLLPSNKLAGYTCYDVSGRSGPGGCPDRTSIMVYCPNSRDCLLPDATCANSFTCIVSKFIDITLLGLLLYAPATVSAELAVIAAEGRAYSAADGARLLADLSRAAGRLNIRSFEDIYATPSVLTVDVLPSEVELFFRGIPGWKIETLGRGAREGQGWIAREYGPNGQGTNRMIRWHPGGGHHGPDPYWKVFGYEGNIGGILR